MKLSAQQYARLLSLLWGFGAFSARRLTGDDGTAVTVRSTGEYDTDAGVQRGAEVEVGVLVCRGDVCFGSASEVTTDTILRVVECHTSSALDYRQRLIPQLTVEVPASVEARYVELLESGRGDCGSTVAAMDSLHRTDLFTRLLVARLHRKCGVAEKTFEECDCDWNQTLYTLLFRAMGDNRNATPYAELARRVPYFVLSREKYAPQNIEALLLGASGLLERYPSDEHTLQLSENFRYLARKYSIVPMKAGTWVVSGVNPNNQPVVRLAELAGYLERSEFLFVKMLECRTGADVKAMFGGELTAVSTYWQSHFTPATSTSHRPKRIGGEKANLLGINFVVPLMFAYGNRTDNESLKSQAVELLESLAPERNLALSRWRGRGVEMQSAFDSQAVLQLNNEFCSTHDCWRCPIGLGEIKKSLKR